MRKKTTEQEHTEQSKIKVVKIDPLNTDSRLLWAITATQKNALKDFVLYMDEEKNVLYVNGTKNIPQKDIKEFVRLIENAGEYYLDDDTEEGRFFEYAFKTYGSAATSALINACSYATERKKKHLAEIKAGDIAPIIKKELENMSVNDAVLYYIKGAGDETKRETFYNMVHYGDVYCFMLGYLIGSGKIDAEDIIRVDEEEEDD